MVLLSVNFGRHGVIKSTPGLHLSRGAGEVCQRRGAHLAHGLLSRRPPEGLRHGPDEGTGVHFRPSQFCPFRFFVRILIEILLFHPKKLWTTIYLTIKD
jgi:hypothetical protein